jgi:cytochrome c5
MMGMGSPSETERDLIVASLEKYGLKSAPAGALPAAQSKGAGLFREFCAQCHALPDPQSHSAAEWPAVIARMEANMETMRRNAMTPEQEKQIRAYLEANARKS